MDSLITLSQIIQLILFVYISLSALYFLFFSVASLFYKRASKVKELSSSRHFAVMIPAYKEDKVIIETTVRALSHRSITCSFEVIVIADSLQTHTVNLLRSLKVRIVEVHFDKSTKAKSLNEAFNSLSDIYTHVLVLDADNIMDDGFIDTINQQLNLGYQVVQGHRTAKNTNTSFAILDAISEEVNNAIFRKGHVQVGLSAALIGSGFVADYQLLKALMKEINAVGGFDKELEIKLLTENIRIGYAPDAIVLDEKIQESGAFVNQRRRWLSSQFFYLRQYLVAGFMHFLKYGNIDVLDKSIQLILPPRIITAGAAFVLLCANLLLGWAIPDNSFEELAKMWGVIFIVTTVSILSAIPARLYNVKLLQAIASVPVGFMMTMLAVIKLKGANKSFIHTAHGVR